MIRLVEYLEIYYLIMDQNIEPSMILSGIIDNSGMRKGSFADDQVIHIFKGLLMGASDLRHMYDTYYSEEYSSFGEYLYKKEKFSEDFIKHLADNETIYALRYTVNNYSLRDIIGYENENLDIITEMMRRAVGED